MPPNPVIELNNVSVFQNNRVVLSEVNLRLERGEFIYIIGKVGSGQSSLLKTLYAELPLVVGTGQVAGFQLSGITDTQCAYLRRKIGIVFQDFQLLTDRNVNENLSFVLSATGWRSEDKIDARINEVLQIVGLEDKKMLMPHELSGGEQQRIVLARALLNEPDLILADEPTGNLDPANSLFIAKLLHSLTLKGKSVIFATHDYDIIQEYPAKILQCNAGKLVEFFS